MQRIVAIAFIHFRLLARRGQALRKHLVANLADAEAKRRKQSRTTPSSTRQRPSSSQLPRMPATSEKRSTDGTSDSVVVWTGSVPAGRRERLRGPTSLARKKPTSTTRRLARRNVPRTFVQHARPHAPRTSAPTLTLTAPTTSLTLSGLPLRTRPTKGHAGGPRQCHHLSR